MNCSESYNTIGFFNGKEKEGTPLICRMHYIPEKSLLNVKGKYIIEIVPNVDTLFMLGLGIFASDIKADFEDKTWHLFGFANVLRVVL